MAVRNDQGVFTVIAVVETIEITPPLAQIPLQAFVKIGLPPTSMVGQAGIHEVMIGVQGSGGAGGGIDVQIPKGVTTFSMIVPTGNLLKVWNCVVTVSTPGATPNVHIHIEPVTAGFAMSVLLLLH